jgi:hypothetical protein
MNFDRADEAEDVRDRDAARENHDAIYHIRFLFAMAS